MPAAYKAGQKYGDTGAFDSWIRSKGLDDRGAYLLRRLEKEFERGVIDGEGTSGPAPVAGGSGAGSGAGPSMNLLDQIAKGQGAKSFKSLSREQQEVVRRLAEHVKENPGMRHHLRSLTRLPHEAAGQVRDTLRSGLTWYDRVTGIPSRVGHRIVGNPSPDELAQSYEEHLGLTTSQEFQEAGPEEQAAMMTGMDMSELGEERNMHEHHEHCGCLQNPPHPMMLTVGKQMSLTPPHPADNYNLVGPFKFVPKYTPVRVQERGRGGHRFLVHGEYFGSLFWGWVEKEDLQKFDPGDPDLRNNPRRPAASGRYLPPGTKVIINDNMRINAPATIVKWGQRVHPLYKTPETALVRMERTGSLQEVGLWAIAPAEGGFPKGSSYSPNPMGRRGRRNPESSADYDWNSAEASAFLDTLSDAKLSKRLALVRKQIEIAYRKQDEPVLRNLQEQEEAVIQARLRKPLGRGKRNPESSADSMFRSFHGYDPEQDTIIEEEEHFHEHLASLGDLSALEIITPTNLKVQIGFSDHKPILASNEDGTQLYIEGGDQEINLRTLKMDGKKWLKESMVLGDIETITYDTEKTFDDREPVSYYHHFTEDEPGEPLPQLVYNTVNKKMSIVGGKYYIKQPLVGVSPGIEN